jgi:hypothetical protein
LEWHPFESDLADSNFRQQIYNIDQSNNSFVVHAGRIQPSTSNERTKVEMNFSRYRFKRDSCSSTAFSLLSALVLGAMITLPASAEVINRGIEGKPLHEARPAPASIFPNEHIIVAQPSPSEVNPAFLGPVLLMKSAIVDLEAGTMTLPLREGQLASGEKVWSILTDVSDENLANLHGVNYSAKMAYGITGKGARKGKFEKDGSFTFDSGKVDFSPKMAIVPGDAPNFFPPKSAQPGALGDADYSPLVQLDNAKSAVFNMPMVAFNVSAEELNKMCDGKPNFDKVHDKVVKICPRDGTVTLKMTLGYTFSKPIFYLSTDSNNPLIATLEGSILAPALNDLPFALEDAAPGESAERIYAFANGPTGKDHPFRQGVNSALQGEGSPLNVLGGIPTINLDYSPIWRLFPVKWTDEAINRGYRTKLTGAIDIENAGAKGIVVSIAEGGGPPKAVGFLINCPVVYRIN